MSYVKRQVQRRRCLFKVLPYLSCIYMKPNYLGFEANIIFSYFIFDAALEYMTWNRKASFRDVLKLEPSLAWIYSCLHVHFKTYHIICRDREKPLLLQHFWSLTSYKSFDTFSKTSEIDWKRTMTLNLNSTKWFKKNECVRKSLFIKETPDIAFFSNTYC